MFFMLLTVLFPSLSADIDTDSDFVVWFQSDQQDLTGLAGMSNYVGQLNTTFADVNASIYWDLCIVPGDIGSGASDSGSGVPPLNQKWRYAMRNWNNYTDNMTYHNLSFMIPCVGNHDSEYAGGAGNSTYHNACNYRYHNGQYWFNVSDWGWYPYNAVFNGSSDGENYNYTLKLGDCNLNIIVWSGNHYGTNYYAHLNTADRRSWMRDAFNDTEDGLTFLVNHYGSAWTGFPIAGPGGPYYNDIIKDNPFLGPLINTTEHVCMIPYGHKHNCYSCDYDALSVHNYTLWHCVASTNKNRAIDGCNDFTEAPCHYFYTFTHGSKIVNVRARNSRAHVLDWCAFNDGGINKHGYNFTLPFRFEFKTKSAPIVSHESPTNNSIDNNISLWWNCSIDDPEGNSFNYTIQCNNSQNVSQDGVTNGTKSLSLSGLSYNTTYTVWVNTTDGHNETRDVFTFDTRDAPASHTYSRYCIEYYRPIDDGTGSTIFMIIGFLIFISAIGLIIAVFKIRGIL